MNKFDQGVSLFFRPSLLGVPTAFSNRQITMLCGWIMLIVTTAEYTIQAPNAVSEQEKVYLRRFKEPPANWSIFVARSEGPYWNRAWFHYVNRVSFHAFSAETGVTLEPAHFPNMHITSVGMGSVFFYVCSSPQTRIQLQFEAFANAVGLTKIWPPQPTYFPRFWRRTVIPPEFLVTDEQADELAHSFQREFLKVEGRK